MKNELQQVGDSLAFVCRTLGWLEVVPAYGDAVSRTTECDKAIKECEKIRATLDRLIAEHGWQPIETAPKNDAKWCIVGHLDYAVCEIAYFSKRHNCWCTSDRSVFPPNGPTHWMPLPQPPTMQGE